MALLVSVLELPARWNQVPQALADVDRLLGSAPAPDLALLPEMALTGYVSPARDFDLTPFAETRTGPTATALASLAQKHRCHLAGPLVERDGTGVHNTVLVFGPDGTLVAHYHKRHPWYPETWATPGSSPAPVFHVGTVRITLAICFDVQFLQEDAAQTLHEADVLLFPSAWVERDDSRARLLPEVARRFDVAVVNANWGAGSPRVPGQGGSLIVEHDGRVVARVSSAGSGATRLEARVRQDL